jgi:hypothetical protein
MTTIVRFSLTLLLALALLTPALPTAASRPRLLIIGDSITQGLAASSEATTYAATLARARRGSGHVDRQWRRRG